MSELVDLIRWWPNLSEGERQELWHRAMWPTEAQHCSPPIIRVGMVRVEKHQSPAGMQILQTGSALALAAAGAAGSIIHGVPWIMIVGSIGAGALMGVMWIVLPEV